ncbi:hypothetical protein PSCICJ_03930 [Pseudomonas cichorii]|nr:hypothetical protein PSCICJ_03930 [Pseudomonas cichorii]
MGFPRSAELISASNRNIFASGIHVQREGKQQGACDAQANSFFHLTVSLAQVRHDPVGPDSSGKVAFLTTTILRM